MQEVHEIHITIPWFSLRESAMHALVEGLSNHSCQNIALELNGRIPDNASDFAADMKPKMKIFSQLLSLKGLKELLFQHIDFTFNECRDIANILSSNMCPANQIDLAHCKLGDGSGRLIIDSVKSNT